MNDKFIKPSLKHRMKQLINQTGISCGSPTDRTLMNRFYEAKERIVHDYETLARDTRQGLTWSTYIDVAGDGIDVAGDGLKSCEEVLQKLLRDFEEVEQLLFEYEFLENK